VTVFKVGFEGGHLELQGRLDAQGVWRFSVFSDSGTLAAFCDELSPEELRHQSEWMSGWDRALQLLDRHRWASLFPLEVHSDFASAILEAVRSRVRTEHELERWREVMAPSESSAGDVQLGFRLDESD
jgi:hypothetical protein